MSEYIFHGFSLTSDQKSKLSRCIEKSSPCDLRFKATQLNGNDKLPLTSRQINELNKAKSEGKGKVIRLTSRAIHQLKVSGGGWTDYIGPVAQTVASLAPLFAGLGVKRKHKKYHITEADRLQDSINGHMALGSGHRKITAHDRKVDSDNLKKARAVLAQKRALGLVHPRITKRDRQIDAMNGHMALGSGMTGLGLTPFGMGVRNITAHDRRVDARNGRKARGWSKKKA